MPSYYLKNGKRLDFRFFEIRNWEESQEHYANEYFKFKVNENDLLSLGYIYWAHIAVWKSGIINEETKSVYSIGSFDKTIRSKLAELNIKTDSPNFGYDNLELNVNSFCWDFPRFKIKNITEKGILASNDEFQDFYFDFCFPDICSVDDIEYESEELTIGTVFSFNTGDPVFMSDADFILIKEDFLSKIKVLNNIYSSTNFPHHIEIVR